jgi:polysaccharide export outer membrane protein
VLQPNDKIVVFSKNENDMLADTTLSDFAFSKKELTKKERELWQKRIEEKLFWKSVGVSEYQVAPILAESEKYLLQNQPIIQLSDEEKEQILEFKDYGFFSRKRLLAPILEKLNQQARLGSPLQILEIAGEVKVPGVYPLTKNATVKDLVVAAGGFTESTYMKKSEITRSEINADGTAQITHISFEPSEIWRDHTVQDLELKIVLIFLRYLRGNKN